MSDATLADVRVGALIEQLDALMTVITEGSGPDLEHPLAISNFEPFVQSRLLLLVSDMVREAHELRGRCP